MSFKKLRNDYFKSIERENLLLDNKVSRQTIVNQKKNSKNLESKLKKVLAYSIIDKIRKDTLRMKILHPDDKWTESESGLNWIENELLFFEPVFRKLYPEHSTVNFSGFDSVKEATQYLADSEPLVYLYMARQFLELPEKTKLVLKNKPRTVINWLLSN